jgi:uncharacterized membrane protein YozB (DUF420 family)
MNLLFGISDIVLSFLFLLTAIHASNRGEKWWARFFLFDAFALALFGTYLIANIIVTD